MTFNLSIKDIEYVLAVYQEKNFTAAAAKLFISQPSLSQAIKKIEENVGYTIFIRNKKGLILSKEGQVFIDMCMRMTKTIRDYENEIADLESLRSGEIIVGMPFHLGGLFMPPVIASFKLQYPAIKLTLIERSSSELEIMLANGELDLAMVPLPLNNQTFDYIALRSSAMKLLMSKDDPHNAFVLTDKDGEKYFDLRNCRDSAFLIGLTGQRIRSITEIIFSRAGISPTINMYSRNIETVIRLTNIGMGMAIVPDIYIHPNDTMEDNLRCPPKSRVENM